MTEAKKIAIMNQFIFNSGKSGLTPLEMREKLLKLKNKL
jgi:hypothetical protein